MNGVVETPPLDQIHWGILVVDAESGRTLYSRSANLKFVPASNAKILVTAAALLEMGSSHTFETSLWASGPVTDAGVLQGDLVVPGDGDPTLSRRFWPDDEAPLRTLVDSVRARGVVEVTGDLVVDASAWDSVRTPSSWMVGNLPWGFSAVGGPFAIAEGTTRVAVEGTAPGERALVHWAPNGSAEFVRSEVVTVEPDDTTAFIDASWIDDPGSHVIWGTIPAGEADTLSVSTRLPSREAGRRLLQLLDSAGVTVVGEVRVVADTGRSVGGGCRTGSIRDCPEADRLAAISSPPLAEIVKGILEPSQNWMTEQLVRALATHRGEVGSWSNGLDVVAEVLVAEAGVDSLDISLRDGSGLSAYNLVTPRAVVAILRRMAASPYDEVFRDGLAAPGEEDSTLERRLLDLEGRVQAKTGTISNVNSLSGYLVTDSGREVVFSILTNGSGLSSGVVRRGIDDVVRAVARRY